MSVCVYVSMFMYVFMYVCVMYICEHVHVCICVHACMGVYMGVFIYVCVYIWKPEVSLGCLSLGFCPLCCWRKRLSQGPGIYPARLAGW